MKKLNLKEIVTLFKNKCIRFVLQLIFISLLLRFVWICFQIYLVWNEIPHQTIKARLSALGDVSDSSSCKFAINISAGSYQLIRKDKDSTNIATIWHRSKNTVRHDLGTNFLKKFYDVSVKYHDQLANMSSFYVLDYSCSSTIMADTLYLGERHPQYSTLTFCYIDSPKPHINSNNISYSGSGFVAFAKSEDNDHELCGEGGLSFNTNLINGKPEMKSPWDVTQANYDISFACENISCDTISIEFYGATTFSNMFPQPDKISMSGIEFNRPEKIQEIQKDGLRFHVDFLELKEMAAMRILVLTTLLSVCIALLANVLSKYIF